MRITSRVWWGVIILLLVTVGGARTAYAQTPDSEFFEETRHSVSGEFLNFFRSLPEPFVVLGYPLSETSVDPVTHNQVQYFQFGRLELQPATAGRAEVVMSDLGSLLYTPGSPPADVPDNGSLCRTFPKTGFRVCRAFMQFYDLHDGEKYFGNPISSLEVQDGRYMQYFERARMEWRPEAPAGQRVALTRLGQVYLEMIQGRGDESVQTFIGPKSVTRIISRAFVAHSLIAANNQQMLYVIAQDADLTPIPNAQVSVTVTLPSGRQEFYHPPATNADGISVFAFNVGAAGVKEVVQVDVSISALGLQSTTGTWFRIWW